MKLLEQRTSRLSRPLLVPIFLAFYVTSFAPAKAQAEPGKSSVQNCSLDFIVKGTDIQILVGYSRLKGEGEILCTDSDGRVSKLPVKVKIGTPVLFPRISFAPSLVVRGTAENVKVFEGPKNLLGKYLTLDIRIAIGGGAAAILALESQNGATVIQLKLTDVEGFGLAAGGTEVSIEQ